MLFLSSRFVLFEIQFHWFNNLLYWKDEKKIDRDQIKTKLLPINTINKKNRRLYFKIIIKLFQSSIDWEFPRMRSRRFQNNTWNNNYETFVWSYILLYSRENVVKSGTITHLQWKISRGIMKYIFISLYMTARGV